MFFKLQALLIFLSLSLLVITVYELGYHDRAEPWKNYSQPQLAAHSSLEKEAEILSELERQQRFSREKAGDASLLDKPNIFNPIAL